MNEPELERKSGRDAGFLTVSNLLSLSRIELDEHSPPTGRADLGKILDRVAGSLELRAKATDMRMMFRNICSASRTEMHTPMAPAKYSWM